MRRAPPSAPRAADGPGRVFGSRVSGASARPESSNRVPLAQRAPVAARGRRRRARRVRRPTGRRPRPAARRLRRGRQRPRAAASKPSPSTPSAAARPPRAPRSAPPTSPARTRGRTCRSCSRRAPPGSPLTPRAARSRTTRTCGCAASTRRASTSRSTASRSTSPRTRASTSPTSPTSRTASRRVQVQRGVGTSTHGVASFAGSVNFELVPVASVAARGRGCSSRGGAYATLAASLECADRAARRTALAVYVRGSVQETDGYRANSGNRRTAFRRAAGGSATRDVVKSTVLAGIRSNEQAYSAVPLAVLRVDPRAQPARRRRRPLPPEHGRAGVHALLSRERVASPPRAYGFGAGGRYDVPVRGARPRVPLRLALALGRVAGALHAARRERRASRRRPPQHLRQGALWASPRSRPSARTSTSAPTPTELQARGRARSPRPATRSAR